MAESTQPRAWRVHPEYPHIEVSNRGEVRSLPYVDSGGKAVAGRTRRQTFDSDGYLTVGIFGRNRKVHQLVMETFVGPRPEGMDTMHLDAIRSNNRLDNLRYGSRSENGLQRVADGNSPDANKTQCPWGHAYTVKNVRVFKPGKRICLSCKRARSWISTHPLDADFQTVSDRYFAAII